MLGRYPAASSGSVLHSRPLFVLLLIPHQNVLGGALFSPAFAVLLLATLTTVGSACATLLAMPLGPLITRFFPRALELTRHALEGDSDASPSPPADGEFTKPKSSAWVRLSVLRLIGVVPWSGINIACGVCGVSIWDCMLGCFIGVLPWTAVTCQVSIRLSKLDFLRD